MKRILFFALLCLFSITGFASARLNLGSLSCLKGENEVGVSFDFSKVVYRYDRTLKEFLAIDRRAKDWEEQSLEYFALSFNKTCKLNAKVSDTAKYVLLIVPSNIRGNGSLKGDVLLKNMNTNAVEATLSFSTNDGDDDDEVTFRDPMRELGESVGKIFAKQLKKINKQ